MGRVLDSGSRVRCFDHPLTLDCDIEQDTSTPSSTD